MKNTNKNNRAIQGFTLIELVIVIVILGILAVTALPQFLNQTDEAVDASVEGVSGGFATAVSLVRSQWEVDGRPSENVSSGISTVVLDNVTVGVDKDTGYPTGSTTTSTEDDQVTLTDCTALFDDIMQSMPSITTAWPPVATASQAEPRFYALLGDGLGSTLTGNTSAGDLCYYYLTRTVKNLAAKPTNTNQGSGFTYDPRAGKVVVFSNN